jgi:ATP-dependent RNA helicase RhlB
VHRIGRTARAGAEGDAISLGCEDYVQSLPDIEAYIGRSLPRAQLSEGLLAEITVPARARRRFDGPGGGGRGGFGGGRGGDRGRGGRGGDRRDGHRGGPREERRERPAEGTPDHRPPAPAAREAAAPPAIGTAPEGGADSSAPKRRRRRGGARRRGGGSPGSPPGSEGGAGPAPGEG